MNLEMNLKLDTKMRVARNLKALRKSARISQAELSAKLSICRATYALYEQGDRLPDLHTLYTVSQLYHVRLDIILNNDVQIALNEFFLHQDYTRDETQLIKLFSNLSDFSKGRLIERAEEMAQAEALKRRELFKFDF